DVALVASSLVRRLKQERETRRRENEGLGPELRPIGDLRLWGPAQVMLELVGITTIGQLLRRSEDDLRRLRLSGPRRIEDMKRRLWATGRWTLRGGGPPINTPALLLFPFGSKTSHSAGFPEQALLIAAGAVAAWLATTLASRMLASRRACLPSS